MSSGEETLCVLLLIMGPLLSFHHKRPLLHPAVVAGMLVL